MNVNVLKAYISPKMLFRAVGNPSGAYRAIRWAFTDYGELASAARIDKAQFKSYMEETQFADPIWSRVRVFDSSLKQRGISGGAGFMQSELYSLLYALIRSLKPSIIVETGVASGVSSCYILKAAEENGRGKLFSIDLPCESSSAISTSTPVPSGAQPGWLIPEELRGRWQLSLGRSSELLPSLLKNLGQIDFFLHDSDHSYENQRLEYETVWPFLKEGGLLLSDDCSRAFPEFAGRTKSRSFKFSKFGILVKP